MLENCPFVFFLIFVIYVLTWGCHFQKQKRKKKTWVSYKTPLACFTYSSKKKKNYIYICIYYILINVFTFNLNLDTFVVSRLYPREKEIISTHLRSEGADVEVERTARMNHASRNVLTATRKRKDRDDSSFFNQHSTRGTFGKPYKLQQQQQQPPLNTTSSSSSSAQSVPVQSNRLLAGYMAYEFLTRGTLFGQKFDPARAEAVPLAAKKPGSERLPEPAKPNRSYAEVAQLLKTDGAHIPGIVNPTQLAKWIQM